MLLALANEHSIYEFEWRDSSNAVLKNKYSLMENSKVQQMVINDRFVVVQSKANAADAENAGNDVEYDYTWIFTKGSRTYANAHVVIDHKSSNVEI